MPAELREQALRWLAEGRAAFVVEVADARGSVPRDAGTRMLVANDAVAGTIGGGHLELQAIEHARRLLRADPSAADRQRLALGPALGQCCGGAVELRYLPLAQAGADGWAAPAPRFHLQLHGAGHVGRAVAALLAGIDCSVRWIDTRDDAFPPEPSPTHIERVGTDGVEAEVALAPPGAFYLVMTHSHDVDLAVVHAVLRRGDFGFVGVIGSQTKRRRFEHRLAACGVDAALLASLQCPVGLPGIAGKEPAVIAVAVVAQLLLRGKVC